MHDCLNVNQSYWASCFLLELPKPNIGDVRELQRLGSSLRQSQNSNMSRLNFNELNEIDSIKVDLVPEKKGVILKHVEYSVSSQVGHAESLFSQLFCDEELRSMDTFIAAIQGDRWQTVQ